MSNMMPKPRCGFYITEKFPKVPEYDDKGWKVSIPEGAVIIYDMEEFVNTTDQEIITYCKELVEYHKLAFEPKELMDLVALVGINNSLPKDRKRARKILEQIPGIDVEPEYKEDA